MVLIHGNGGNVASMSNQIEYFKSKYRITVADSRAQGRSEEGTGRLTYEQITDDWAALLDVLKIDSAYLSAGVMVVSGLLMGIRHPSKVNDGGGGANLQPDSSAVYPWAVEFVHRTAALTDSMIAKKDTAYDYKQIKKLFDLLGNQPHISLAEVQSIKAPTLVLAGDKDVIREEHTLQIYQNLKKGWLCIFGAHT
jgi:pimeloyl-ACP methyl ester carboxylesterase